MIKDAFAITGWIVALCCLALALVRAVSSAEPQLATITPPTVVAQGK
jgi:hypothetical protein